MTCGCMPTPQSILDDEEIDVFESMIPNTEYEYQAKRDILWATFRYRALGSGNLAYWLQCMKDRYAVVSHEYDIKIRAWNAFKNKVTTDGVDFAESSSEYDQVNTREDVPDNATGSTEYLSERTKTNFQSKGYGGLESETTASYIDGVPRDPYEDFAREFSKLFFYGM